MPTASSVRTNTARTNTASAKTAPTTSRRTLTWGNAPVPLPLPDDPTQRRRLRRLLPDRVAFYLQASIVVSFLAASSAPTPLYQHYQAAWNFSPITTTIVFGIYAIVVLLGLLIVGSLSDHVGRRPVLMTAIALQIVSMVIFTTAGSVSELLAARIVQGIATGGAIGAVGAGMLDLDRVKGTITNAVAPPIGTGTGALISGILVQYLPAPDHLVYLVLIGVFILQGIGIYLTRETSARESGALASLRPRISVPKAARSPMLKVVPVLIASWALAGFYASVGPAVVGKIVGSHSPVIGGLSLFILAASAGVTVLLLRNVQPRTLMLLGTAALIVGVGITLIAMYALSSAIFFTGAVIAGAGFGAGFQGAIRMVVPLAAPHERSGLLSAIYVASYLALGLPAVIGGYLVVHGGLLSAGREYGAAVMVLSAIALLAVAREKLPARS